MNFLGVLPGGDCPKYRLSSGMVCVKPEPKENINSVHRKNDFIILFFLS